MKDTKIYKSLFKTNEESFRNQWNTLYAWCKENYYHLKNNADYVYCEPMSEEEIKEIQNNKIVALIREKYSLDEELAILRQRDTKPDEFTDYFAFVETCKATIKGV